MQDYRNLRVWQKAHELALATYRISACLHQPVAWPLRDQALRAAISIPSNIAEGREEKTDRGFANFLRHALRSATELENHYLIARGMGAIPRGGCDSAIDQTVEVKKMLHGLIKTLDTE